MCDFTEGYDVPEDMENLMGDTFEELEGQNGSGDIFDELTDDLNVEQLSYLKDEIQNGNEDIMELFGYDGDSGDEEGYQKVLKL